MKFYVNELVALEKAQSKTDGVKGQTYSLFLEHSVALAQSASRISDVTSLVLALVRVSSEIKGLWSLRLTEDVTGKMTLATSVTRLWSPVLTRP